ncbi:MAG: choice-of-anchor B family protein [Bacteroidia bacterium]
MKKYLLVFTINLFLFANGFSQDSLNVNLLFHWDDPGLPGSSAYNNTYNEIWGFVQDNREYAVIGSTMGTHIFDVTDPVNSVLADFVPGGAQGTSIIHRDFHDYNGFLYMVADEGTNSTLQIVDLSYLPDSVHKVYDSNVLIKRAHNIFIDTATAKMYVGGGFTTANNYLSIYSLNNPVQPVFLKSYTTAGYVHDMYVRNDTAYLNAGFVGGGGTGGLHIVDFTDTQNPVTINTLTNYPFSGYNHSGWLNEQGNIYVFADETHGMPLKVLDVSDFNNLQVLSTLTSGVASNSIPHNVLIRDNYAYVSYYYDGLYIFNLSDPSNPFVAGFYDTSLEPNGNSYKGAWGVYPHLPSGNVLLSDMQNGLYVFDVSGALVTSVNENIFQSNSISVYPNPASDILNIIFAGLNNEKIEIALINNLGQNILNNKLILSGDFTTLDVKDILPGIYTLKINSETNHWNKKIIIR